MLGLGDALKWKVEDSGGYREARLKQLSNAQETSEIKIN